MKEYKIVFTGSPGAGKTTAIQAISDSTALSTDVANSDASLDKAMTTVGMDFGVISLEGGERVRLFGTPGQSRFDFMWTILAKDAMGIVFLVDNSRPAPLEDLGLYLDGFGAHLGTAACVVGVGRTDTNSQPDLDAYASLLHSRSLLFPVVAADVRRRDDVQMLVELLLVQMEGMETPA